MIESEGQSSSEQPKRKSLFPLSQEAATRALHAISKDPQGVIDTEWQQRIQQKII